MNWEALEPDKYVLMNKHFTEGRQGRTIDKVIIHHNGSTLTTEGCYQVWQSRQASAHYQVEIDGTIGQLVNDWDTAWSAGDWNANLTGIAIEHANNSRSPWSVSLATLEAGAHLVAALCRGYNLGRPRWMTNVFPHSAFQSTECPGSLGPHGMQHAAYMDRAGWWYDAMTSDVIAPPDAPPVAPPARKIESVPFAQWPLPHNEYFGDINGPEVSHGGFYENERVHVRNIQRWLIIHGYAGNVDDRWADGLFEQPTIDAVAAFQRAEMPGTQFFGQVWWDDYEQMMRNNG